MGNFLAGALEGGAGRLSATSSVSSSCGVMSASSTDSSSPSGVTSTAGGKDFFLNGNFFAGAVGFAFGGEGSVSAGSSSVVLTLSIKDPSALLFSTFCEDSFEASDACATSMM